MRPTTVKAGFLTAVTTFSLCLSGAVSTADGAALPGFRPVPAGIKARMLPVDPKKGYLVKELKPNV